jgi:hypothetical protein
MINGTYNSLVMKTLDYNMVDTDMHYIQSTWRLHINSSASHSKVNLSQQCHMNIRMILNNCGTTDIWNSRWYEPYTEQQGHSCILLHWKFSCSSSLLFTLHSYTMLFTQPYTWKSRGSEVQWPQRSILWTITISLSWNCSSRYSWHVSTECEVTHHV